MRSAPNMLGDQPTAVDWRLWVTLVRLDKGYAALLGNHCPFLSG